MISWVIKYCSSPHSGSSSKNNGGNHAQPHTKVKRNDLGKKFPTCIECYHGTKMEQLLLPLLPLCVFLSGRNNIF